MQQEVVLQFRNCVARIIRPELSADERARRVAKVQAAAAALLKDRYIIHKEEKTCQIS